MERSQVNTEQLKGLLKHVIHANEVNQAKGIVPGAINVIGPAGLGKTSVIQQVAEELGYKKENIYKLNLATLEEIGDLIGIPCEEYKMVKKTPEGLKGMWVKEKALASYEAQGFTVTTTTRMSYSVPEWIVGKSGPGVLILDDYTRASQRFTQAVMELILTQEYASWKLPLGWTIILSSNPDDGMYNVTDQDPAQQSRYLNLELKWDVKMWAEWAEKNKIDSRCINFVLMHPEIVNKDRPQVNGRSICLFFNAISTLTDFSSSPDIIQNLGEGSLGTEVATMFTSFVHSKMDRMITVEEMLDPKIPFSEIEKEIESLVSSKTKYRADIACVLTTRLINHLKYTVEEKDITEAMKTRVGELMTTTTLGTDLKFVLTKKVINANSKFATLLSTKAVMDVILE